MPDENEQRAPPTSPTIATVGPWEGFPHTRARESVPEVAHEQEPLLDRQEPRPRPGEAALEVGIDTSRREQNNSTILLAHKDPPHY